MRNRIEKFSHLQRALEVFVVSLVFWTATYAQPTKVFVLAFDGFAASDLNAAREHAAFKKLVEGGTFAEKLVPSFPPITFSSFATLSTGCPPSEHGVVGNRFIVKEKGRFAYEDDPNWLACEPLWVSATRQGVKSVVFNWVLSYGAWNGTAPAFHYSSYRSDQSIRKSMKEVLEKLDDSSFSDARLFMAYFPEPDRTSHRYGPDSKEESKMIRKLGANLDWFLSQLEKRKRKIGRYAVVVLSDHGMMPVTEVRDFRTELEDSTIPGVLIPSGPLLHFHLWNPAQKGEMKKRIANLPGLSVFDAESFPGKWGKYPANMGDFFAVADPGTYPQAKGGKRKSPPKGMHGYDNQRDDMAGIFLMAGDGIKEGGSIPVIQAVDVAATIAQALGINPPKNNQGKTQMGFFAESTKEVVRPQ